MRVRRIAIVAPFFGADLSAPGPRRAFEMAQTLCARNNLVEVLATCARSPGDDWSANYFRPGIDRTEPFPVRRFAVDERDRAPYERADAVFADAGARAAWTRETVAREHERAIVEHGIVSHDLVAYLRSAAWTYDAFVFLSYRESITFAGLPAVVDRAILVPGLRREPFAITDSARRLIRSARALAFTSDDEYALAVTLYGPSIVAKSRSIGPVASVSAHPSPIEQIGGFDLRRNRYVAAFADHASPYAIEPIISAFRRHAAASERADLRLFIGGLTLWEHLPGVRAVAQLSAAERESVIAHAAAVIHVDRDDPVAAVAIEGLANGVAAIVGERGTPRLAQAVRDCGAGWLIDAESDLGGVFATVAGAPPDDLARYGSQGPDALAELGRSDWPARLEAIVDGLQAIEDNRTREQTLAQIAYLYPLVRQMRADIGAMQASRFWRLRDLWFGLKDRLGIGAGDTLRRYDEAADVATLGAIGDPYFIWAEQHRLRADDIDDIVATIPFLPARPTLALNLTVRAGTSPAALRATVDSLLAQLYATWRLNVVLPPESPALAEVAEDYAARDPRVTLGALVGGDFAGTIEAGDLLERDALYRMALALNTAPGAVAVYADLDFLDERGIRCEPFFKPDWSPETFLGRNLFAGLAFLRAGAFEAVGGLRDGLGEAAWYDAALRVTETNEHVVHVARVVLHRRSADGARAAEDERRAVADALVRRGEVATVEPAGAERIAYRSVRYAPRTDARITVIVPTRDRADLLERCIASVFDRSTYPNFNVLVVDNGSTKRETHELFARWSQRRPDRFRVVPDPAPFNFAALNNRAVASTDAEFVVFLNNDTVAITPDWLEALQGYAQRPKIGAAGAALLYPDDTIQHGGVLLAILGLAGHAYRHFPADANGYFGGLKTVTNYSAVTGACMMIERRKFLAIGGFDERFAVAWNDVDLCLRLAKSGLRNVFVPSARLYHFESKTRGGDDTPAKVARAMAELRTMRETWPSYTQRDPYYSPHLTVDAEDFGLRI